MDGKKRGPSIALVLGGPDHGHGEDDGGDAKERGLKAVESFFSAGQEGDYETALSALKEAVACCDEMGEGDYSESDEGEEKDDDLGLK